MWILDDALTLYTHLAFPRLFLDLADMAVGLAGRGADAQSSCSPARRRTRRSIPRSCGCRP